MKMSKMFQLLMAGLFLSFSLAACAGSDAMARDDMTHEKKMDKMEMKDDGMKGDMKGDMKDTMMKEPSDAKPMMTSESMKGDTMMRQHPTAMLAGSKGHHAAGKVSFVEEMGKTKLVLSDINVDKVPDGHVYLAKNGDRKNGIDLGVLKQFTGNVTFALPADADPAAYDNVIIYCEKFHVEIGRANFGKTM